VPSSSLDTVQITTNPPGVTATLDNDPSKTCTSPCSFQVPRGHHLVGLSLPNYRPEFRTLDVSGAREVFVTLTQPTGTVRVQSDPPGAEIFLNNQPRSERTPATFVLPVGAYTLAVVKDGKRTEQAITVRDGALVTFNLQITQ
jgi:hypothetical protein